jgi:hypothetical protein
MRGPEALVVLTADDNREDTTEQHADDPLKECARGADKHTGGCTDTFPVCE